MSAASKRHSDPALLDLPFSYPIRVYWEDTDAGGVVYHAQYLCFLERASTEWVRAMGVHQQSLRDSDDLVLAVREMNIDFLKPARLDDLLQATVLLTMRRSASFTVAQELFRDDQCLLRAQMRIACLHASTFKPRPLPKWMLANPIPGEPSR